MKLRISDPLGLKTGIRIDNVKSYFDFDPCYDQVRVYGTMEAISNIVANNAEPEIYCNFLDADNRVCYTTEGKHVGTFWINRFSTFRIELQNASQYLDWNEICSLVLYVAFK